MGSNYDTTHLPCKHFSVGELTIFSGCPGATDFLVLLQVFQTFLSQCWKVLLCEMSAICNKKPQTVSRTSRVACENILRAFFPKLFQIWDVIARHFPYFQNCTHRKRLLELRFYLAVKTDFWTVEETVLLLCRIISEIITTNWPTFLQVQETFKLYHETLYLAVRMVDRYIISQHRPSQKATFTTCRCYSHLSTYC